MPHSALLEIYRRDPRYECEAYEFVFEALAYTQQKLGRVPPEESEGERGDYHVTGPELLDGIRELALEQFGRMALTVFHRWGIHTTDDFGEIVFNLIEAGLMSKRPEDSREDFHDVYDLEEALSDYHIHLDEL
ncbi:MAG: hypothetical protein RMJ19_07900 [Gemmatales bacterium]|nr:hypothetical protein [Gemmatales bacterium]MDW8175579.1 hypothetical protein [Gemmatales bacterium]MDW8223578.1 hypothetical protein [Gemmatales bacterium]